MDAQGNLLIVRWANLERWDYLSNYLKTGFKICHPLVPLSAVFKVRKREASPAELAAGTVSMLDRVSFEGEIFAGERQRTKMKQFVAEPGDVVVSKIRARQGSVGLVEDSHGKVGVTIHYRVLTPSSGRILSKYAHLALRSQFVRSQFLAATGGAMKGEISEETLLDLKIPVPSVSQQAEIVGRSGQVRAQIENTEARVQDRRRLIERFFIKALGLRVLDPGVLPKVVTARWSQLARWSVGYNQQAQAGMDLTRGRYAVVPLGSLLTLVQYGTSEKANSGGLGTPVLRINNIKDGVIETGDLKHLELPSKTREGLLLEDGDILIIRTSGSRDLVGTCAVFHEQAPFVFASYLIRLRADARPVDPDFAAWLINSPVGRQQVNAISRPIMQNNINSEEIRTLRIPLPPLEVQRKMMNEVQAGLAEIEALRAEASARTAAADAEIERLILGGTA